MKSGRCKYGFYTSDGVIWIKGPVPSGGGLSRDPQLLESRLSVLPPLLVAMLSQFAYFVGIPTIRNMSLHHAAAAGPFSGRLDGLFPYSS